ncbi:sel1 repeat family protein [Burkholderia gladioli]|uniref:sel1 repeat family protein n=1 Tax=Burkholderia gladioli TaxID=28095 RepID=UPI0019048601|nr:sel1 repeat family protein [Burkholderia gladioli]MBJ9659153.1 sel1 repeat family protein [Burkholderia gladioli]
MSKFQEEIAQVIQNQDCYFLGDALPPDWYAGFKLWLPLAEAGDPKAMLNVGYCLTYGKGADEDRDAGLVWYRRLADLGDARGMLAMYLQLKGGKPDEAEEFLQRAVAAGDARAKRMLSDRDWKRDEQARKAREAAETQEREAREAQQRRDAMNRSGAVVAELKALLERGDNEGACQRAERAIQEGLTWAGSVVAATSLQLNVNRTSRKSYTTLKGASTTVKVMNGVYNTTPVVTAHREYTYKGTLTNPTAYPMTIDLFESRGSRFIPAGGTVDIGKDDTLTSKWPDQCTLFFGDPMKSWAKMTLKRGKTLKTSSGVGKVWKIVGTVVALYVAMRLYHVWVLYQHWHGY